VIPFVGTFVGASIALLVTLASGGGTQMLGLVAGVILCLHLLEAAVLTPKIVGHRVGLSESGALLAVVAGGKLLGFVGVVLAVPIAATTAVLVRYAVRFYEHTSFFGHESDADVVITPAMALIMPGVPGAKIIGTEHEPEVTPELEPTTPSARRSTPPPTNGCSNPSCRSARRELRDRPSPPARRPRSARADRHGAGRGGAGAGAADPAAPGGSASPFSASGSVTGRSAAWRLARHSIISCAIAWIRSDDVIAVCGTRFIASSAQLAVLHVHTSSLIAVMVWRSWSLHATSVTRIASKLRTVAA